MKNPKLSAAARREENWGWIMVAPSIIGLLILNIWPFIQTIYTSFCEHAGFGHYKFIGLQNYIDMFTNGDFWKATWNMVWFCVFTVPGGMVLALFVAMLLNAKVKFKGGFRTIFFLPLVCAPAAIAMVWQIIFNGDNGMRFWKPSQPKGNRNCKTASGNCNSFNSGRRSSLRDGGPPPSVGGTHLYGAGPYPP